jgi:hypothetical protein
VIEEGVMEVADTMMDQRQKEVDKAIDSMTGHREVDMAAVVIAKRKNLEMERADETIALTIIIADLEELEDATTVTTMALVEDEEVEVVVDHVAIVVEIDALIDDQMIEVEDVVVVEAVVVDEEEDVARHY